MIAQAPRSTSLARLDARIYALAVARGINTMGFSIVLPFLAIYLYTERGIAASSIGAVYTLSGIVGAATQVVGGELADRFGRRLVMVSSLLARAGVLGAMGVAIGRGGSFATLGGLVVANAMLRSLFEPAAFAAVTDLAPIEDRVAAFGVQRIGINVGWAMGPALGAYLASGAYGRLFFLAVPATVGAAALCARVRDVGAGAHVRELSLREFLSVRRETTLLLYLGVTLLAMILVAQLFSTLSIYTTARLGLRKIDLGHLYTLNGVLVVLLQFPAVRFIERIGRRQAVLLGPLIYALAYASMGLARTVGGLALCVAGVTVGELVFLPAQQSLASQLGDPERQGRVMGLYGLTFAAGQSFGPLVGGVAIDHLIRWPLRMWGALGLLGLASFIGYALVLRSAGARRAIAPGPSSQ
ncbi:MAG TPA: MFS transporter [Polyangia bacterium]|nr:MFS transporter [Polyangia bacterium]